MEPNIIRLNYHIPLYRLGQAAFYILRGRQRNLGADFRYLIPEMPVSPAIRGTENLPISEPFVIAANHYERPGLWMAWSAMVAGRAVYEHTGRCIRWIAISEWHKYRVGPIPIPPSITRFVFGRFFATFGFIPMAPQSAGAEERRQGVRDALDAVDSGDAIGIFPEGDIGPTPAMIEAQPGSGSFLAALNRRGALIIPTGLFEEGGRLTVVFGESVDLSHIQSLPRAGRDGAARANIMTRLASLLPENLRGFYA